MKLFYLLLKLVAQYIISLILKIIFFIDIVSQSFKSST
jgi:hypothetical protein